MVRKDFKDSHARLVRVENDLSTTMNKVGFQEEQRKAILDTVQEQVIPIKDILFQTEAARKEQAQAIAVLELKLNKSYLMLTTELD